MKNDLEVYEKINRKIMLIVCVVVILCMLAAFTIYVAKLLMGDNASDSTAKPVAEKQASEIPAP